MPRLMLAPKFAVLSLALMLAACTRSQPNFGLTVPNGGATGAFDGQNGPITPGSAREFTAKVGDSVYFSTDSVELSANSQQTLTAQAQWLQQYSNYPIMIEGHADERGTREYNIALGAQRAVAVKQFLIAHGVNPARIKTMSYGKERPVAVCADITCWSQNRRAVTVLSSGAAVASQ